MRDGLAARRGAPALRDASKLQRVGIVFGITRFGASKAIRRVERKLETNAHKPRLVGAIRAALEAHAATFRRKQGSRAAPRLRRESRPDPRPRFPRSITWAPMIGATRFGPLLDSL